jgi:hypothetical protein
MVSDLPMTQPRHEKLLSAPAPAWDEVALLYYDDCNPVRDHFVCYCVSGPERPRRYAVASMASEDTDFYDYNGPAPEARGLETYCIYRVHGSDKVSGYDQHHIVLCLSEKTIDFTGQSFGVSEPEEGSSALTVLLDHVRRSGVGK